MWGFPYFTSQKWSLNLQFHKQQQQQQYVTTCNRNVAVALPSVSGSNLLTS